MKCQHYNICMTSPEPLCNDRYCSVNSFINKKEVERNREECRSFLDGYKKSLGITSFLELNERRKIMDNFLTDDNRIVLEFIKQGMTRQQAEAQYDEICGAIEEKEHTRSQVLSSFGLDDTYIYWVLDVTIEAYRKMREEKELIN